MDLHSPKVKGKISLDQDATYNDEQDLVPRKYVNKKSNGMVVIRDVVPTNNGGGDIVGFKEYVPNTIPASYVLTTCIANTPNVRILFDCEPDRTSFSADVTVNGQAAVLESSPNNPRLYNGYCDLVLDDQADKVTIRVESDNGEFHEAEIDLMIGGPVITSAQVDALPDGQTHVKSGDVVAISGVVANDAIEVSALAQGASASKVSLTIGDEDSAGAGFKTFAGQVTISAVGSDAPITVVAKNFLGTETDVPFQTANVPVDQQYPVIPNATYAYPAGQAALKDGESVSITSAVQYADVVNYAVQTGFSVEEPDTFAGTKVVTLNSGEAYSFNNQYYTVTATRSTNGAQTQRKFTIDVANAAPVISIAFVSNPAHLRSSQSGNAYKLRVNSNQPIDAAPSLTAAVGTMSGSWVKKSTTSWETEISIADTDARGTHSFADLVATGRAGVVANTINAGSTYEIAGFLIRDVVVPALSQKVAIGTDVVDTSKVTAFYKGADQLTYFADKAQHTAGFSIVDADGNLDPNGNYLWISDANFAGTNTSGTLILTVEEV